MERYCNYRGNSNVVGYEIGDDYIRVKFSGTPYSYDYTYATTGVSHVEKMKQLARAGCGLNSYINRNVKYKYERKN